MKVLAIETATSVCGAAIVGDGKVLANRSLNIPHCHSEKIMTLIDEILHEAGLTLRDIDGIAVSAGPGSFTGLRVGVSTAKGLAFASGHPVSAVSTLEALAHNFAPHIELGEHDCCMPLIAARRGEVYAAAYTVRGDRLTCTMSPRVIGIETLPGVLNDYGTVFVGGDAAESIHASYPADPRMPLWARIVLVPEAVRLCDAGSVGLLGELQLIQGRLADASSLEPVYLQETFRVPDSQTLAS